MACLQPDDAGRAGKKLRIAVAVGRRPRDFDGGERAPDGGPGWELFGELYESNPRSLLTAADFDMLRLWRAWRGGGLGSGDLPESGGAAEQAVAMIEAFELMSAAEAKLKDGEG